MIPESILTTECSDDGNYISGDGLWSDTTVDSASKTTVHHMQLFSSFYSFKLEVKKINKKRCSSVPN